MEAGLIEVVSKYGGFGLAVLILLIGRQFMKQVLDDAKAREEKLMDFVVQWSASFKAIEHSLQSLQHSMDDICRRENDRESNHTA